MDGRQALRESHVEGNAAGANNLASIRCSRCLVYSYSSSVANLGRVATPEMDAFELAERISSKLPGVRILYTSGYTDAAAEGPFIQKPFTPAQLVAKVDAVLTS